MTWHPQCIGSTFRLSPITPPAPPSTSEAHPRLSMSPQDHVAALLSNQLEKLHRLVQAGKPVPEADKALAAGLLLYGSSPGAFVGAATQGTEVEEKQTAKGNRGRPRRAAAVASALAGNAAPPIRRSTRSSAAVTASNHAAETPTMGHAPQPARPRRRAIDPLEPHDLPLPAPSSVHLRSRPIPITKAVELLVNRRVYGAGSRERKLVVGEKLLGSDHLGDIVRLTIKFVMETRGSDVDLGDRAATSILYPAEFEEWSSRIVPCFPELLGPVRDVGEPVDVKPDLAGIEEEDELRGPSFFDAVDEFVSKMLSHE
ncbi:hypothetical protein DFJ74DRAFT_640693 [Hyaloraphidium curvatum]|nr:hypothetical protein DFJ74DRAFT_640693 [Hyaloraphidium curvatum]